MSWDLSKFTNKDVILTGDNRDMTATRQFLEKYAKARSYKHVFVTLGGSSSVYDQLGQPDPAATIVIKAPGVPGRQMGVPYITSAELFLELVDQLGASVIGVTGTKGKTTTASLIQAMLEAGQKSSRLCGNIGSSFLPFLDGATATTIFVAELSSQMLEDVSRSPHIGVITNLFNDHADYHGTLEAYRAAKKHLIEFMKPSDVFIYSAADPLLTDWASHCAAQKVPISGDETIDMSRTKLIGEHNKVNALLARAAAQTCGVSPELCQQALDGFEPISHRLQPVATVDGRIFVDDAIASLPEAAIAAIQTITTSIGAIGCLLLGGKDRDYDFHPLMQACAHAKIPSLVLFPETVAKMKAALPSGYTPNIFETSDMKAAVSWAHQHAPMDSVVLLSSGAPSYSLWKDFEEKGNQFQAAVRALADGSLKPLSQ